MSSFLSPRRTYERIRLKKERVMVTIASALQLQYVLYEKKGPIAYLTINRPKVMNALNQAVFSELKEIFEDARDASSVHGIILTGSGDKGSVALHDLAQKP